MKVLLTQGQVRNISKLPNFESSHDGMNNRTLRVKGEPSGAHVARRIGDEWWLDTDYLQENSPFRLAAEIAYAEVSDPAVWHFNGDYDDYTQVEQFMPAFLARLAELTALGKYRYNDSFKGHIPGAAGHNEDTAIYLLQVSERFNAEAARFAALEAEGYEYVTHLEAATKFRHIVLCKTRNMGEQTIDIRDGRLLPDSEGAPMAVLPKGKRTNGYRVSDRKVLALR